MKTDYLSQFLDLYWIRPETAIFNALLAKHVPKHYLSSPNSADINCGDGLFSFILNGGKVDSSFSLYRSTKLSSNRVKNEDIYSHIDETYNPKVISPTKQNYMYGIDINQAMLHKANTLPIYTNLLHYTGSPHLSNDNHYPLQHYQKEELVSLDGKLDLISIFSSIYMYEDVPLLLRKMNQLLTAGGHFYVNVKTPDFRQFYERMEQEYPAEFAQYIERNMRQIIRSLFVENEWEKMFEQSGFEIEKKIPSMHKCLAPVWTIGLRFLTPLLIKLSHKINDRNYAEIKQEFSSTFYEVLSPFYEQDIGEACSYLYVLKKPEC